MLKPRKDWPIPASPKADLVAEIAAGGATDIPGNVYEFSQPIQHALERADLGRPQRRRLKIFGDDLDVYPAAARVAGHRCRRCAEPRTSRPSRSRDCRS